MEGLIKGVGQLRNGKEVSVVPLETRGNVPRDGIVSGSCGGYFGACRGDLAQKASGCLHGYLCSFSTPCSPLFYTSPYYHSVSVCTPVFLLYPWDFTHFLLMCSHVCVGYVLVYMYIHMCAGVQECKMADPIGLQSQETER